MKRKVGILCFTEKLKERAVVSDFFDGKKFWGFRYIISEIDRNENQVDYISFKQISSYDYVLVELVSYYDVYNLINEVRSIDKGDAKIVVGGPGVNNIRLYSKYIDFACFGRGEGVINDILNGDAHKHSHIWEKARDPRIEGKYTVGKLKTFIKTMREEEVSVGCRNKCFFCHFSWFHHFVVKGTKNYTRDGMEYDNLDNYSSSFDAYEDFFQTYTWERRRGTTALDGCDEWDRYLVNKPMSKQQVIDKLKEFWLAEDRQDGKGYRIKIYQMIGYPWDNEETAKIEELKDCFRIAEASCPQKERMHRIFINMHYSHFIPMPWTPMYWVPYNFTNYQKLLFADGKKYAFVGNNFVVHKGSFTYSAAHSFESTVTYRMFEDDLPFFENVFMNRRYNSMKLWQKLRFLEHPQFHKWARRWEFDEPYPTDFLETPHNYKKVALQVKKRWDEHVAGKTDKRKYTYTGVWKRYEGPEIGITRWKCERDDSSEGYHLVSLQDSHGKDYKEIHTGDEDIIRTEDKDINFVDATTVMKEDAQDKPVKFSESIMQDEEFWKEDDVFDEADIEKERSK